MPRAPRQMPSSQKHRSSYQRQRNWQHISPALYSDVKKRNLWDVKDLGQLRNDFKTKNAPPLSLDTSEFERIVFPTGDDPTQHHLLHGQDGGILGYYIPAAYFTARLGKDFFPTLISLIENLPMLPPSELNKNVTDRPRKIPNSRTYASLRGYRTEDVIENTVRYAKDNKNDGKAEKLVEYSLPLWQIVGSIFKDVAPKSYRNIHHPERLPSHIRALGDPFTALTINSGSKDYPVVSAPHRDVLDAFYAMSCLLALGEFQGGELILWELKKIISLKSGDIFIFPAHLITHSNTPVTGIRHSMVAYTKEELLKYFVRQGAEDIKTRLPLTKQT
jgi:hypothetical protein